MSEALIVGVPESELDSDSDDDLGGPDSQQARALAGMIPPDLILGRDGDREALLNLMASDEVIEELQKIVYRSHGGAKRQAPGDKENVLDFRKIRQLENRLGEVVKENETLIDELQDRKFEVYSLKNKDHLGNSPYGQLSDNMENRLSQVVRQSNSHNNDSSPMSKNNGKNRYVEISN